MRLVKGQKKEKVEEEWNKKGNGEDNQPGEGCLCVCVCGKRELTSMYSSAIVQSQNVFGLLTVVRDVNTAAVAATAVTQT